MQDDASAGAADKPYAFGTSFGIKSDQKGPGLPVRGGIQVLPPLVPPRALNGIAPQPTVPGPAATPRPKPKPPLPPKRDELTRLTTVSRRDPERTPPPPPKRQDSTLSAEQIIPDVVPVNVKDEKEVPPEVPPRPDESALEVLKESTVEHQESVEESKPEPPVDLDLPRPDVYLSREPSTRSPPDSPSSEDGATADIWVRAIESPVKRRPSVETPTSQPPSRHASTGDEAEEKPLKKDRKDPNDQYPRKHRAVLDKSYIKSLRQSEDVKETKTEVNTPSVCEPSSSRSDSNHLNVQGESKKRVVVGTESLPCSRPGSRTASRSSSPASFVSEKPPSKARISAAEALGVVAKPCPRPPPAKRSKQPQEYRRQSLGNLSDSKLSIGYDRTDCTISCTIRGLWNSVGATEVQEGDSEYKKHDRGQRGSSADGSRTLSRIKFDCGHPSWDGESIQGYSDRETSSVSGYSTLSRIGRNKTDKYFARSTTPVQCGYSSGDSSSVREELHPKKSLKAKVDQSGRPKSTCNCGHHTASTVRVDAGKRTFSVEELTTALSRQCEFSRAAPGSARGSFGKSPRVTFALAEDMGASGGAVSRQQEPSSQAGASKKILRGKSLPTPVSDAEENPRCSGLARQHSGAMNSAQGSRSQPAIGLKQTPKTRVSNLDKIR